MDDIIQFDRRRHIPDVAQDRKIQFIVSNNGVQQDRIRQIILEFKINIAVHYSRVKP